MEHSERGRAGGDGMAHGPWRLLRARDREEEWNDSVPGCHQQAIVHRPIAPAACCASPASPARSRRAPSMHSNMATGRLLGASIAGVLHACLGVVSRSAKHTLPSSSIPRLTAEPDEAGAGTEQGRSVAAPCTEHSLGSAPQHQHRPEADASARHRGLELRPHPSPCRMHASALPRSGRRTHPCAVPWLLAICPTAPDPRSHDPVHGPFTVRPLRVHAGAPAPESCAACGSAIARVGGRPGQTQRVSDQQGSPTTRATR